MLEKKFFMPIEYFKKTNYLGSISGMRFCIGKHEEGEEDSKVKMLRVTIWPGPFSMDKTDPSLMYDEDFPFSPDGIEQCIDYVNSQYADKQRQWDDIPFWTPELMTEYTKKYEERLLKEQAQGEES